MNFYSHFIIRQSSQDLLPFGNVNAIRRAAEDYFAAVTSGFGADDHRALRRHGVRWQHNEFVEGQMLKCGEPKGLNVPGDSRRVGQVDGARV